MGRIRDLSSFIAFYTILTCTKDNNVPVGHSDCYLGIVTYGAHAMDTLRNFNRFDELQREFVIHEDAAIATSDKEFVHGDDRAVHLSALDIQSLKRVR